MAVFGFSGLPSSPTSQQTSFGSIQPWAQPYISNYLNQAQNLVAQSQPTALQQQAYTGAANLQVPGQFEQGANLAQQAGQGMLGTTGTALNYGNLGSQYGALGAGYGQQASGAGQNYFNMATNPAAMQAFMNPYIEQSLAPQLKLLNQQQALAGQGIAAKAVGQGAFGGNRATLAQSLNAQNYDLARQQAIGQGYNQAFQQAQQAQQFGAGLGLQGLQAAMQGAGLGIQGAGMGLQGVQGAQAGYQGATQAGAALGNLGAQQNAAQLGILGLQNQLGTQQYNLPYQNLQYLQGMMSGLPISTTTQQGYTAPPSTGSQLIGAGTTILGGYLAGKAAGAWKKGGAVKSYADGGDIQSTSGLTGLMQMRPTEQENYTGVGPTAGGALMQLRPTEQENYTGFSNTGGGPLNQLRPTEQENYTGFSSMGGGLSGVMPIASVVNQNPVTSNELANLYQQYLGRGVDASGAKSFTGLDRTRVLNAIINSPEYQSRGLLVPNAPITHNALLSPSNKAGSDLADIRLHNLVG